MLTRGLRRFYLLILGSLFMVVLPNFGSAMTMGDIKVYNKDPNLFHGEVPITLEPSEKISKISVTTGNRTDYAVELLGKFKSMVVDDDGQKILVITGRAPQEVEFFTLLVSIDLGGRTINRNFPVHMDGLITPLPPRKLSEAVSLKVEPVELAVKSRAEQNSGDWLWPLLWWVVGAVLAVMLFWIWWSQGLRSDEDILIKARESRSKLPSESWESLMSNDDEPDAAATHVDEVPAMEELDQLHKREVEILAAERSEINLFEAPQEVKVEEPVAPDPVVKHPAPPPSPPAAKSSGRLSIAVMQGHAAKPLSPPPTGKNLIGVEDFEDKDLSIGSVMHSLEQVLDDKNRASKSSS
ncbi:MAG: hypothetical protein HQL70_07915 [Magnetococcales bacterium]|nr:hypothetical protein [Magnetococcales bacterium]